MTNDINIKGGGDLRMYKHHKDSIDNLSEYFKKDKSVIAVLIGGSIAKGCERVDSDIDAIVVVTDQRYNELYETYRLSETILGYCTYENGYFDIKYVNKGYLKSVARNGSEPARVSFEKSWCIYSTDKEIESFIQEIPVFQKQEKAKKMLAFYSAFELNNGYFWSISNDNPYSKARAITDIVLFGLRLILQDREILFPCNKGLLSTVSKLGKEAKSIVEKAEKLISTGDTLSKDDFASSVMDFIEYEPPKEFSEVLTSYINNHELWWYKNSPVIAEW